MRHSCSECGKTLELGDTTIITYDCADVKHYMHKRCWHALSLWLSGVDDKEAREIAEKGERLWKKAKK